MEAIVFDDLTPIQVPVRVFGQWYVLCEASEKVATEYQNAGMAAIDLDLSTIDMSNPDTIKASLKSNVKGFNPAKVGDTRAVLLGGCLFKCDYNEDTKVISNVAPEPVGTVTIQNWPSRITSPLVEKAKEISELDKLVSANPFPLGGQKSISNT